MLENEEADFGLPPVSSSFWLHRPFVFFLFEFETLFVVSYLWNESLRDD